MDRLATQHRADESRPRWILIWGVRRRCRGIAGVVATLLH
jgi:hypothetical protein